MVAVRTPVTVELSLVPEALTIALAATCHPVHKTSLPKSIELQQQQQRRPWRIRAIGHEIGEECDAGTYASYSFGFHT